MADKKIYYMETEKVHEVREVQAVTRGGRGVSGRNDLIGMAGVQKRDQPFYRAYDENGRKTEAFG